MLVEHGTVLLAEGSVKVYGISRTKVCAEDVHILLVKRLPTLNLLLHCHTFPAFACEVNLCRDLRKSYEVFINLELRVPKGFVAFFSQTN